MSKLSLPQPSKNTTKELQLKFFVANNSHVLHSLIDKKHSMNKQSFQLERQQCMNQIIDTSLLDYKNHYFKDIQTRFPLDQIVSLLISPKILTNNIQFKSLSQWRQFGAMSPELVSYWFALFFNHNHPTQYFQQQLQLLTIIIEKHGKFYGFLGYAPKSLIIYNILEILMKFYDINFTQEVVYFSEQGNQFISINQLKNISVGQAEGMYIKVCSLSYCLPQIYQNKESRKQQQLPDLLDLQESYANNQQMESQLTNHAPGSQNWQETMELETSFEQKSEYRNKLIAIKSAQQLQKLKNKGKLNIQPKIPIPGQSQIKIMESLKAIIVSLQNNLKIIDI